MTGARTIRITKFANYPGRFKNQNHKISRISANESAIAAAIEFCDADAAIFIDADLQHPPAL
jgi:glycosyltransferase involved in cell wall biosynthesis